MKVLLVAICLQMVAVSGWAAELAIKSQPYGAGGLFTRPLIPGEKDTVTITVRATVQGEKPNSIECRLGITAPDGKTQHHDLPLAEKNGEIQGEFQWQPERNGFYEVRADLDPKNRIAEVDEKNNSASITLPVVVSGRRPHFPWFGQRDYLRWATIWAGGFNKEQVEHWFERGVTPLAWKYGNNFPNKIDEEGFYKMYSGFGETFGIAVDECGFYPQTLAPDAQQKVSSVGRFVDCLRGMARAKKENPDKFFLMWHCGSFYPEQAAMYRSACDLVVIESYVTYFGPKGLFTENVYNVLDMKMLPARQLDMLNATGKGPQVITSIDLKPQNFHRGEIENILRHLRRTWPEMRGFGIFGGLIPKEATEEQRGKAIADEQFVDRLYFDYFVPPVVTILPGNVWVSRPAEGGYRVEAAISNIGGMTSGPVEVSLFEDGRMLEKVGLDQVPAGDSLLENRAIASVLWQPAPGNHRLEWRIVSASGSTVLDARQETEYYVE